MEIIPDGKANGEKKEEQEMKAGVILHPEQ